MRKLSPRTISNWMRVTWRVAAGITIAAGWLHAQPSVCWVINAAFATALTPGTQLPVCSPDPAVVAQGSLIAVMGTDLGPAVAESAEGFPLRTSLAGASVRLITGGVNVELFVLSAQRNRIQAMLPSRTPLGDSLLVATYNGVQTPPYKLRVAGRGFQVYRRGPLAMADNIGPDGAPQTNDFTTPVRPAQTLVLWGTGLGAVEGDEKAGPVRSSASGTGVEVMLGLQRARVLYAGRSDCCAGMDQIVVETPAGVEGCSVPVVVLPLAGDAVADFGSVSIAARGGCSDPHSMPEAVRRRVSSNGGGSIGRVTFGPYGWTGDGLHASFTRFGNHFVIPAGACGYPPPFTNFPGPDENYYWDAGPELALSGAFGESAVPRNDDDYNTALGSFYGLGLTTPELEPGSYTIHNGEGGPGVGAFKIAFPVVPPALQWTNRSALNTVQKGQDVTVTWTAGQPDDGYVAIDGTFLTFVSDPNGYGFGGFSCLERADKGSFTVPAWLLWTNRVAAAEVLELQLQHYRRQEFAAPGLDFGEFHQHLKTETLRANIAGR